jgi:hypothetical protein
MMDRDRYKTTTAEKANLHDITMPLLRAMYGEFKEFSKKKPDDAVSEAKVRVVNRLLIRCRDVLESETSIEFLDLLDEDEMPRNSDVVLTLSQYVAAMNQFRSTYYGWNGSEDNWFTK